MARIRNAGRQQYVAASSPERAVIVAVEAGANRSRGEQFHGGDFQLEASLDELARLSETAGLEVAGQVRQSRHNGVQPASYMGTGKLAEVQALSATTDELRTRLMPVNSRYPLEHLIAVCRSLPARSRRRLTCAYTMLAGVNDAPADARRLTRLLHGIRAKVNLIPFNAFSGSGFTASPRPHIDRFRQLLLEKGVLATIRESRGRDVLAACGQLATHGETIA